MLTALDQAGRAFVAYRAERNHGDYFCPECLSGVILRKGFINIHHFAHRSIGKCFYGSGESPEHHNCKLSIYNSLLDCPRFRSVRLEHKFLNSAIRADIGLLTMDGQRVGIEVQRSAMTEETLDWRTEKYLDAGIAVLWLIPEKFSVDNDGHISQQRWHRRLHAMYYGRIYAWSFGSYVTPIHLEKLKYWVQEGDYRYLEPSTSSRWRAPVYGELSDIAEFRISNRKAFHSIPAAKIFHDEAASWW